MEMETLRNNLYTNWLKGKTIRDKALQYMDELDSDRAKTTESLIEVAISLSAVDRIIGDGISQNERRTIKKRLKDFRESCDCGFPCKHCGDDQVPKIASQPLLNLSYNEIENQKIKENNEDNNDSSNNSNEVHWLNDKESSSTQSDTKINEILKNRKVQNEMHSTDNKIITSVVKVSKEVKQTEENKYHNPIDHSTYIKISDFKMSEEKKQTEETTNHHPISKSSKQTALSPKEKHFPVDAYLESHNNHDDKIFHTVPSSVDTKVESSSPLQIKSYSNQPTTIQVIPTKSVEMVNHAQSPTKIESNSITSKRTNIPKSESPSTKTSLSTFKLVSEQSMQTDDDLDSNIIHKNELPISKQKRYLNGNNVVMLDQSVQFTSQDEFVGRETLDKTVVPEYKNENKQQVMEDNCKTKPMDNSNELDYGNKEKRVTNSLNFAKDNDNDNDISLRPPFVVKHICTCLHPCLDACKKSKRPVSPSRRSSTSPMKTIPLDIDARPVFVVRHVCQCVTKGCECTGLCKQQEEEIPLPTVPHSPPPVYVPKRHDVKNYSSQTVDVETFDFGIQSQMPTSDIGIQQEVMTSQQEIQTYIDSSEQITQTEQSVSEQSIQQESTYFRDQGCQTIQPKDKPRFAVRNICMCALKDTCVGCCDTNDRPKKNYVNPVFLRNKPTSPEDEMYNYKHSCQQCFENYNLEKAKSKKSNDVLFRPPFSVKSTCISCNCGGVCDNCKENNIFNEKEQNFTEQKKAMSMKIVWMKWAMSHHTFNNVILKDEDVDKLSGATTEFLISERDLKSHDKNFDSIKEELNTKKSILPSLRYFMSNSNKNKKNDGLRKMELTPDQRLQNKIFIRECTKLWIRANAKLNSIVIEYVVSMKNKGISTVKKNETRKYYDMSLKQLRNWKEIDDDKRESEEQLKWKEKKKEGQEQFAGFVKKKDSVRIRVPGSNRYQDPYNSTPIIVDKKAWRRNEEADKNDGLVLDNTSMWNDDLAFTSLKLMSGQGLKYIHATKDYEKCKQQLIEMGIVNNRMVVLKENFEQDKLDEFFQLRKKLIQKAKEVEEEKKRKNETAFNEFISMKQLRERALKCLNIMPKPIKCNNVNNSINDSSHKNNDDLSESPEVSLCIAVGKALKGIDRTLFIEWADWCNQIFNREVASTLWDYFSPRSCEVHSTSHSQLREILLKLFKPGVDYKKIFVQHIENIQYPSKIDQLKNDPIYQEANNDDEKELALIKLKTKWLKSVKLELDLMVKLLNTGGVEMNKADSKYVLQAFDTNREGKINAFDFLQFIDPTRLNDSKQNCCWGNTCRITGLNHAYSVFIPSKRFLKSNIAKIMGMDKAKKSSDENQNLDFTSITGKLVIRESPNGIKTAYMESTERKKRIDILRNLGLFFSDKGDMLSPYAHAKESLTTKDDIELSVSSVIDNCDHSMWKMAFRSLNMQFLIDISREAFQEKFITKLFKEGKPPHPPKLFAVDPADSNQKSAESSMLSQLLLNWKKGEEDDLVSFYSLEFGGKVGFNTSDIAYSEICRDPPDADPDHQIQLKYLMKGLLPGCSYYFRIRALNGYGSSNYTYRIFTTNASAPMRPTVLKLSSDSVTISWGLTKRFYKRYKMLKGIFDLAKVDNTGKVDLSEKVKKDNLMRVLNEKVMESQDLKKYVIKIARSAGIDTSNGFRALFDLIDVDEEGKMSWEQFELFLISNNIATSSEEQLQHIDSLKSDTSNNSAVSVLMQNTSAGDIRYVVERCISDIGDETEKYEEVLKTDSTEATIKHLNAGCSYRFRVYSISKNGNPGPKSQSLIVHTFLDTPVTPTLSAENTIGTHSVTINWSSNHKNNRPSDEEATGKLLDEWAGRDLDQDKGVSVEVAFKKIAGKFEFGRIDISRLIYLFKHLNVDSGDQRLQEAIESLDKAKTGSISYEAFKIWWNNPKFIYSLRRSNEIYNSFDEIRIDNPTISLNNTSRSNASPLRASKASLLSSLSSNSSGSNRGTLLGLTTTTLQPLTTILEDKSFHEKLHIASAGYNARPRTSGSFNRSINGNLSSQKSSESSSRISKNFYSKDQMVITNIPVPHEYKVKDFNSFLVTDLIPNRMYQFRMKHIGSRASSMLSYPLSVMTRPLQPSNPILLDVTATSVRIKWYPPKHGAFKFMVQLKQFDETWIAAYYGQENCWTSTIMNPDTHYEVRVVAINYLDLQSEPSDAVSFQTLPRDLSKSKIPSFDFKIESAGDICVGDIILITERLYLKGVESDGDNNRNINDKVIISSKPMTDGTFIGERTVAALVLRDNYRMMRDKVISHNQSEYAKEKSSSYRESDFKNTKTFTPIDAKVGHLDYKNFRKLQLKNRKLWLEILWQRSGNDACKIYEYKVGDVVVKKLSNIEQFEVLRCEWKDNAEEMRKPLKEEWDLMSECFIDVSLN